MSRVKALDHIVLKSPDMGPSLSFLCGVLGLDPMRVDDWREDEVRFPSVAVTPDTIIELFPTDDPAAEAANQ